MSLPAIIPALRGIDSDTSSKAGHPVGRRVVGSMRESDKIMFEVYREASYNRRYKVVYFTELNEQNKETEINRALAGEHFFDGFLSESGRDDAKVIIDRLIDRLNNGESVRPEDLERELSGYLV
jgi:hypothetical protein